MRPWELILDSAPVSIIILETWINSVVLISANVPVMADCAVALSTIEVGTVVCIIRRIHLAVIRKLILAFLELSWDDIEEYSMIRNQFSLWVIFTLASTVE